MELYMIGIDLAKTSFSLHAVDKSGRKLWTKTLKREQLADFMANTPACKVAMEACGGCHYWSRTFRAMGHSTFIIAAQFVKPFVKSQKNDSNDAEAIVEAAMRPSMRFVATKEPWQQDIQSLHRMRQRVLESKVSLSNQVRGLLAEYGVSVGLGAKRFRTELLEAIENSENQLTDLIRRYLSELYEEYVDLESRVRKFDKELERVAKTDPSCKRLMTVPGVGILTSTAFVSAVGDPNHFRNGREVGAWLGLVPSQFSTGGRTKLGRITKRGDCYLRQLMVHGARSFLCYLKKRQAEDAYSLRAEKLWKEKGYNKACVALANRNARIMWALLKNQQEFVV